MIAFGIVSFLFFIAAGYYGAVRAVSLDFSFDWVNLRVDEENRRVFVLDWRRKVRMMRFLMASLGCFFLVWAGSPDRVTSLGISSWGMFAAFFAISTLLWVSGLALWLRIGSRYPAVLDLKAFPVRFGEWVITPLHWIAEPFLSQERSDLRVPSSQKEEVQDEEKDGDDDDGVDEQMIINAIEFKDVKLRDCMIPRTEITGIDVDAPIGELREAFVNSGHSKIIVYRGSVDNVLGYSHMLSMFKKPKEIEQVLSPLLTVPEAMPASDLMIRFLEERKNLAVVVDEFGGTSGLVSIEDIIEQIFGEIQDEYDFTEDWIERKIDDQNFVLSARHEIDYLNEKYNWNLPEGDYDTLGGLIIALYEDIPDVGDVIELSPFVFTVETAQDNRIDTILLTING
jgi:CBS domain containing-hemolysin-like protein